MNRRTRFVVLAVAAQLLLVGVAVAGQLSARLTGEEYLLRVGPVDPIDPFRGAYVELSYPDLQQQVDDGTVGRRGRLYVVLERRGDVHVATGWTRKRPDHGVYLACSDRDWRLRCGIESLFLSQDEAARVQEDLNDRDARYVARIRVDRWGNAAVVDLERR